MLIDETDLPGPGDSPVPARNPDFSGNELTQRDIFMSVNDRKRNAFTLIELLIVVAIIAILAAIAVPNFLEAQTRSKVSRAKADLRTLATGIESYRVDFNGYPQANPFNTSSRRESDLPDPANTKVILERLSTPVAYLTNGLLADPFSSLFRSGTPNSTTGAIDSPPPSVPANEVYENRFYKYTATTTISGVTAILGTANKADGIWVGWSSGPDTVRTQLAGTGLLSSSATVAATLNNIYDPTNGTVSQGDVFRVGGAPNGRAEAFFTAVQSQP